MGDLERAMLRAGNEFTADWLGERIADVWSRLQVVRCSQTRVVCPVRVSPTSVVV